MIDFILDWFIPIIDPIIAFMIGIEIKICIFDDIMNIIIVKGAIFCQVDRIIHGIHDNEVITDGNHKWHGTIPNFINRDISNKIYIICDGNILVFHSDVDIISSVIDAIAWIRKYFRIASDSWNLLEEFIIGKKDSILISNAVHVINQLLLDITIIVLNLKVMYVININGDVIINIKI